MPKSGDFRELARAAHWLMLRPENDPLGAPSLASPCSPVTVQGHRVKGDEPVS